jgi:Fe-S oxidoreductase
VSAYDTKKQNIARSMVKILNASGLRWGVLGNRESCSGDPARRLGEENLYQSQARKNIDSLSSIRAKVIVANCPHCFNTIQNEYPQVDGTFLKEGVTIQHHSHFIRGLLERGALKLQREINADVTFHDPCYLGRHNDTYEEPREVLVQIGGVRLHEMTASRNKGMCCGAGGGHFWMDLKKGERINVLRVNQAAETEAEVVATGCPFCMQMIDDGIKLTNRENDLRVRDIAEFVAEALGEETAAQ